MSYSGTRSQGFIRRVRSFFSGAVKAENALIAQVYDLEEQLRRTSRSAAFCEDRAKKYLSELRVANQSHDRLSDQSHTLLARLDRIAEHGSNSKNGTAMLLAKMARGKA